MPFFSSDPDAIRMLRKDPDIFLVRIPSPAVVSGATNCFVVMDGGEQLIVDIGPRTREGLRIWRRAFEELGLSRERLVVYLTHLHDDHAGGIHDLHLGDMPVLVPRLNHEDALYRHNPQNYQRFRERWVKEGFPIGDRRFLRFTGASYYTYLPPKMDVRYLDPGAVVHVGGHAFEVMDTSGHVPGHSSLFQAGAGILFNGDHLLFDVTPVFEPCAYHLDVPGLYVQNLRKIQALDVSLHCHAHGALDTDTSYIERADKIISRVNGRIERSYATIERKPGLTGAEVVRRMGWRTKGLMWEELGTGLRENILQSGLSILDALLARGRVYRELDALGRYRYYTC